ncbi:hypothetical protein AB6A40_007364 [Gnathostoma spinigerum]|uniref:EamA domain-containing protein n=1 Tax=Gnathostoma spinigerum TaxID=75299 RepID=A0ABD6EWL8_9BILA
MSWALSTQFSKSALTATKKFYSPYFLVWFNTSFMIACYPVYAVFVSLRSQFDCDTQREAFREAITVYGSDGFRFCGYFWRTGLFLFLWMVANFSYSASLGFISASATSIIMSSNVAMVCILGWIILKDRVVPLRLLSIVAAIAGVALMSRDKEFASSWQGIGLSILSAAAAATYKVLFKKVIGNASLGQVSVFMSGLGLMNVLLNVFPMITIILSGAEHVEWAQVPWFPMIGAAVLSLLFNFLINFGIALLHPIVISVGMLFGIPISAAIDILFRSMVASKYFFIGAFLILFSSALVTVPTNILLCSCGGSRHPKQTNDTNFSNSEHVEFNDVVVGSSDSGEHTHK